MENFLEFIDKKERESRRHLKILQKLLESHKMKVAEHLDEDDPYIFLWTPKKNVSFDGVRIYSIGTQLAYRVQKEEHTHPFGKAYALDIEEMFNDLLSEYHKPEEAGKKVINSVIKEMQHFFEKSAEAEKELRSGEFDKSDPLNKITIRSGPTDYSSQIFSKGN